MSLKEREAVLFHPFTERPANSQKRASSPSEILIQLRVRYPFPRSFGQAPRNARHVRLRKGRKGNGLVYFCDAAQEAGAMVASGVPVARNMGAMPRWPFSTIPPGPPAGYERRACA